MIRIVSICMLATVATATAGLKPGDPIDYSKLAFYPNRWKEQGFELQLVPWKGEHITFLTATAGFDGEVMQAFVGHLDQGWKLYADLTGRKPAMHRQIAGSVPIAAVPGDGLSCGYGCGYVGSTGIEMTRFYDVQYPALQKNPKAVPHAYFYEMGRNYYTFGDRHDCFTTGFAVFMRYVCIDNLELVDSDLGTRKTIESAIDLYAKGQMPFLKAFTNADDLSEKQSRLSVGPSDQPVMYASAMLKLRREYGDDWLKRFFRQLATCPGAPSASKEGARQQSLAWFLSASCAAKKDLSPVFADQWRLPLSPEARKALAQADWKAENIGAASLLQTLPE